jgi:hypothetical protein
VRLLSVSLPSACVEELGTSAIFGDKRCINFKLDGRDLRNVP